MFLFAGSAASWRLLAAAAVAGHARHGARPLVAQRMFLRSTRTQWLGEPEAQL